MTESHFISAGGAKTIAMAVMDGTVERGFAMVRPPGHHAYRVVHGTRGFCNVNIEAIMIEYLRRAYGVQRVAIVDTDCHHGDGTQDIYWHDPNTLFISMHQDGRTLYPGTGFLPEMGGPNAIGTTINIPLPPNTSDEGYLYATKEIVLPILADFKPQLIINSAGQDNHYSDPITNMNISAQGYAALTTLLQADIAVLEGGYAIEGALPYINTGIILAMAGLDYDCLREPDFDAERYRQSREITEHIELLGEKVLKIWRQRELLTETARAKSYPNQRNRHIYYDKDGIHEQQNEMIRICDDCGGALRIESTAGQAKPILAVHIPFDACSACQDQGHQWYESADRSRFANIFLQDRITDRYLLGHKK
jgi:acetoin utilization deacetylase AcuC-like enzyme